jgi:hypothetical protein
MMRSWKVWAAALMAAGLFFGGGIGLFQRQFAAGELYPEFSSLRTDRMGTKLIYDSLARLPGITAERNFLPLEFLPRNGAAVLLLGISPLTVNWNDGMLLRSAEGIAARGNRVIVAMYVAPENDQLKQQDLERRDDPKKAGAKEDPPLQSQWKVTLKLDPDENTPHRLYFGQSEGWKVLKQDGARPLAIERDFGKGGVVLMTEGAWFANGTSVDAARLPEVAKALGPYARIVFDEQHLGIAESGSVVGMARQFRLMGLAAGLALCAALFIWHNASAFPPPAAARAVERASGRTSHAGLLTLLKRHIRPADLPAVCWREWLSANGRQATSELKTRAETILAGAAARPVDAMREIQTLLDRKGTL